MQHIFGKWTLTAAFGFTLCLSMLVMSGTAFSFYETTITKQVKTSASQDDYSDLKFECRLRETAINGNHKFHIAITPHKYTDLIPPYDYVCIEKKAKFWSTIYECKGGSIIGGVIGEGQRNQFRFKLRAFGPKDDTCDCFIEKLYWDKFNDMK